LLERVLFNFIHATKHSGINRLIAVGFSVESRRASTGGEGVGWWGATVQDRKGLE